MANVEKHLYEFGPFHIDTAERLLYRGEELIPLTPKAIDTLLVLIANRGRVVEKDELMKIVWPDTFVEEGALARNVSALRKALGEDNENSQYIVTIPKRGYRFVAPVKDLSPAAPAQVDHSGKEHPGRGRTVWLVAAALLILLAVYFGFARQSRSSKFNVASLAVLPLHY